MEKQTEPRTEKSRAEPKKAKLTRPFVKKLRRNPPTETETWWHTGLAGFGVTVDPTGRVELIFDALDEWFGQAEYEGCFFINSLLETRDHASPVREAATVYINGSLAGSVWRPPYEVDVTKLLHAGDNRIRVVVGNLAINELAGQSLPDYRLLNLRYGVRFEAQDMQNLQPLPAGLLGPIHLVAR